MGSIQFVSFVKTARLPELSPKLEPPRPKTEILNEGVPQEITLSLAAGLSNVRNPATQFPCETWFSCDIPNFL